MDEKEKLILLKFEGKEKTLSLPKTFNNLEQDFLKLFQKNKDENYIFYYEDENKDNICLEDYIYSDFVSNIKHNNQIIFVIENKDINDDNIDNTPIINIESSISLLKKEIEENEKTLISKNKNNDNKINYKKEIEEIKIIEENLKKEINNMKNNLKLKEEYIDKLEKENKKLKEENKNLKIDLENKIKELNEKNKELKNSLENKINELKIEKEKNEKIFQEKENQIKEIQNSNITIKKLEEKLNINELELSQIKTLYDSSRTQRTNLPNITEKEIKELNESNIIYISNNEKKLEKIKNINKLFTQKIKRNKNLKKYKKEKDMIDENKQTEIYFYIKYYKIKQFRKYYDLDEELISNEKLIEIMKKCKGNPELAMKTLFP